MTDHKAVKIRPCNTTDGQCGFCPNPGVLHVSSTHNGRVALSLCGPCVMAIADADPSRLVNILGAHTVVPK